MNAPKLEAVRLIVRANIQKHYLVPVQSQNKHNPVAVCQGDKGQVCNAKQLRMRPVPWRPSQDTRRPGSRHFDCRA